MDKHQTACSLCSATARHVVLCANCQAKGIQKNKQQLRLFAIRNLIVTRRGLLLQEHLTSQAHSCLQQTFSQPGIMSCLEWFVILVTAARDTHSPPDVFDFPIKRNHRGMSYFRVISSNECTLCDACRRRRAVALLCSFVSCKHKRFRRFL